MKPTTLPRSFYARPAPTVAIDLVGTIIVRKYRGKTLRARIVETEAYLGPIDLASHASKGRTRRTEIMFGHPGYAYVYLIYGMYDMFNIVVGKLGDAHAVLIRAAEPLDDWQADLSGPGKLARALHITRADNAIDLTQDRLHLICADPARKLKIVRRKRIGVDYAKHWKDKLLRFFDHNSPAVSKR